MNLQQVLDDYLKARKDLKPRTLNNYQCVLHEVVPDWFDKPLVNFTREMIAKRHSKHGQANSKARANNSMYEYHDGNGHPMVTINPVKYLSHTWVWYRVDRKQKVIKPHQLADWYKAVIVLVETDNYRNAFLWHDYFLLLLFTGMRKMEASSLRWEDIDLKSKTITLQDTKNHEINTPPCLILSMS
ncbi:tyrosine-type recombinase/integrase [Legionella longbeachae]|uniref:tyrosine-type recombinase/integrase n=1 Tax=Legionella longbeachae TaxID=450 RepID=UPI00031EA4D3|nr:tyrosine-type recombinase/integrase [Legionella longbeachae]VEE03839.1 phage integrase [Legionella oakridgensis]